MTRTLFSLLCCFLSTQAWGLDAPDQNRLKICIDFECEHKTAVRLTVDDWRQIRGFFTQAGTAQQERAQIARYIAFMEKLSGQQTPTWRDHGENDPNVDPLGQLDCIAESTNTTRYLKLLQSTGLLRHHTVGERHVRNPWWLIPHWTAVIVENDNGQAYAVDSWFLPNGRPPVILPLQAWLDGQGRPQG